MIKIQKLTHLMNNTRTVKPPKQKITVSQDTLPLKRIQSHLSKNDTFLKQNDELSAKIQNAAYETLFDNEIDSTIKKSFRGIQEPLKKDVFMRQNTKNANELGAKIQNTTEELLLNQEMDRTIEQSVKRIMRTM